MSKVNGHDSGVSTGPVSPQHPSPPPNVQPALGASFTTAGIKELIARLEVPFHPSLIEFRVINTSKREPHRGQVIPYADPRVYTDRLNELFTPAGWTRNYVVHTSSNFQRGKDNKTVAKVFVTCQLTILGLGSHSATGEEWADDENAGTSAEAQAFKRACACFGLGRYLYHFSGVWVDLDDRKRPKETPQLFGWATPKGWAQGLRPHQQVVEDREEKPERDGPTRRTAGSAPSSSAVAMTRQIESLEPALGKALYRGLLKTVANAWTPQQIHDLTLLQRTLEHMHGAQRGLLRVESAVKRVGPEALERILRSLHLTSLARVDNLDTLKRIVDALEASGTTAGK